MTRLEERLRTDLPALADALLAGEATHRRPDPGPGSGEIDRSEPRGPRRHSRRTVLVGAAVVAAGATVGLGTSFLRSSQRGTEVEAGGPGGPASFGSWVAIAGAPIEPRPYAVRAWTGSKVVFWAGSSLSRGFAYTDGALYDPVTDTWESMTVPGWGHPGLTSSFFDGELYALAKGGGTRFDPVAGVWRDLPVVEGMFLTATVATDDSVWGLGPADLNPSGQPDVAIARYRPDRDAWEYGPSWEGTGDQAAIVAGMLQHESTALWTGTEIVVCGRTGGCIGFDPATGTWRSMPSRTDPDGPAVAVVTDLGLTVIGPADPGQSEVAVDVLVGPRWIRRVTGIPIKRFDTLTAAAAGQWLVLFASGQAPTLIHLPSGAWHLDTRSPVGGVEAPNTVWTGDRLVVWGGVADDGSPQAGAMWTPPEL